LRRRFAADGEMIVMHASNFRPVKNVGFLVELFATVAAAVPARLVLVGDGPELPLAQRRARDLGVADRVVALGNQEAIEELLPLADLFVLPSHHESFGLAALEAMACGVAVIATSVGGTREVIQDGTTGFLRHPADISGWAETALAVLRDPALRQRIQTNARNAASEGFCHDPAIIAYEEEYEAARERARSVTSR
jgi:N-acetyl-alpha-D-glucosaminyl L-malate synthase BshA